MNVPKFLCNPDNRAGQAHTGRRSFMWKMGTAVSAALVSVVPGMSKTGNNTGTGLDAEVNRLSNRLAILEDEKSIRELHQTYESRLDQELYDEVVELFAEDAVVEFNGGVFDGRKGGVSRLYRERFRQGRTGKMIGPVPDSQAGIAQQRESIKVAADRMSARASFPYSIQVGAPMAPDSQLVIMARLHGEGIMKWCECGSYEASYVKDTKDGSWKIARLEFRVLSKTDFRPGKPYARPISVPALARTYPEDPAGPDRLITPA